LPKVVLSRAVPPQFRVRLADGDVHRGLDLRLPAELLMDSSRGPVESSEPVERFVQRQKVDVLAAGRRSRSIQRENLPCARAFFSSTRSGVVHQNAPHRAGSGPEKMRPVLP
jgi:hypothetical protein